LKQGAFQPHEISDVQLLEKDKGLLADAVFAHIGLQLAGPVPHSHKGALPK